jgi:D-amino-acid dehydrogenase
MHTNEIVVIGGGVVGLNAAFFLRRRGARVTVLERDRVGSGASRGNAGEICPDLIAPLPAPGLISHAIGNLYRRDSALYIRPQLSAPLTSFLWHLSRNANARSHARGMAYLNALADPTHELFLEYKSLGIVNDINDLGYLYVFSSAAAARARWHAIREQLGPSQADLVGELLASAELRALEPCLGDAATAGFLVRDQWAIDPSSFVDELANSLRSNGVEIIEGARVTDIDDEDTVVVRSSAGNVRADTAIIAAGVGSTEICRRLGVRLPVFPGKGYSFFVPVARPPSRVLKLEDAHVIVTPMSGQVRVAGTMELDSAGDRFNPRRIYAIVAAAAPFVQGFDWQQRGHEWMAPRPMTPTGLPIIRPVAGHPAVIVASGHNMLGLMLAPATGKAIADLLVDGRAWFDVCNG